MGESRKNWETRKSWEELGEADTVIERLGEGWERLGEVRKNWEK